MFKCKAEFVSKIWRIEIGHSTFSVPQQHCDSQSDALMVNLDESNRITAANIIRKYFKAEQILYGVELEFNRK